MKKITIMTVLMVSFIFHSCQQYESVAPFIAVEDHTYDGTLLDFLSDKSGNLAHTFDSMLVIIDGIPGLREELEKGDSFFTLFAVPDKSFDKSFEQLNAYRANQNLGGRIGLDDLLVEPFTVNDTTYRMIGTIVVDTIIVTRHYDYRAQLDSIFCRYLFEGSYDTKEVLAADYLNLSLESYKHGYRMNMACQFLPASGVVGEGSMAFKFSDMNNSQLREIWDVTDVIAHDIYARDGVIHIVTDQHKFSFEKLINNFKNRGNEYIFEDEEE